MPIPKKKFFFYVRFHFFYTFVRLNGNLFIFQTMSFRQIEY
jgi:hypothetical protein